MGAAVSRLRQRLGRRSLSVTRRAGAARRWFGRLLGSRGIPLMLMGIGKFCFGIGYIAAPQADPQGLELLTMIAPLHCWAYVWVLAGTITFLSAFLQIGRDRWGYVAALVPPVIWAFAYGFSAATGVYARGFYIFIWYMTSHVGLILWASRVPEFDMPHRRARRGPERGLHP